MDPLLNQRTTAPGGAREDELSGSGPSRMLRIVSIIVIVAMVLGSASVIITLTALGPAMGLVIFAVAIGIAGLLVWRWNRQGQDGDIVDAGS